MKPWGPMAWLLEKMALRPTVVVGCIGAEERSTFVPRVLGQEATSVGLVNVRDEPSEYTRRIEGKVTRNRRRLRRVRLTKEIELGLFADDQEIAEAFDMLLGNADSSAHVVLDISCLPKRFFFLMVKLALKRRNVETLIVAYTQARQAGYTYEHLAWDPEVVRAVPGFGPMHGEARMLVVGLGFEPLGLAQLIGEYRDRQRDVRVLLPFPPGQPYSRRVWRSMQAVGLSGEGVSVTRVGAMDAFGCCGAIEDVEGVDGGSRPPALAPYGPKPMSLGMCLYAVKRGAAVLYTQPRFYHPDYTLGVGECWGYCVKMECRRTF